MSQSRCTLSVRGLDCPNEVEILRAALEGSPGVTRLGFDLIHGLMTVDYETSVIDHEGLLRRVRERAGMQADLAGQPETASPALTSWWSRHGRWVSTVSSGLALGIGLAAAWLGPMLNLEKGSGQRLAQGCFALAVCCGGAWLLPRAVRSLRRLPARYRRAHGTGDPGGDSAWGNGTRRPPWPSCSASPSRSSL